MNRPPPGHYRSILPTEFSHIRLARTDVPIVGMRRCSADVADRLLPIFDASTDTHAPYYANALRTGGIVACVYPDASMAAHENRDASGNVTASVSAADKVWAPGELFLRS